MSDPNNFTDLEWHVTYNRRGLSFIFSENSLNIVKFSSIIVENTVIFGTEVVTESLTFDGIFEFLKQFKRIFDVTETSEICINEIL